MAIEKLATLSQRERQVLQLRCEGKDYKTIGQELNIAIPTVKFDMGRVYIKLNLDTLGKTERLKALLEVYCPVLDNTALPPSPTGSDVQPVVPEEIMALVVQDERNLVVATRPGPLVPKSTEVIYVGDNQGPQRPAQPNWGQLLIALLFGMVLMLGLFFLFRQSPGSTAAPQVLVVITATGQPAQATWTPAPTYTPPATFTPPPTYTPYPTPVPQVVMATTAPIATNVVVVATEIPLGGAIIGALNIDGSVGNNNGIGVSLYPKTLVDANGQLHGDSNQETKVESDRQTALAVFVGLTPGVYIVCFDQINGTYKVGEITIQPNITLRQNFNAQSYDMGAQCKL